MENTITQRRERDNQATLTLCPAIAALADADLFGFSCTDAGLDRLLAALGNGPNISAEPDGETDAPDDTGDRWDGLG